MDCRIVYLMSGAAYLPYLVCSLYSLRQVWDGYVSVFAWPESKQLVDMIARDKWLNITAVEREPEYRGKNGQFLDKIKMMQDQPTDTLNMYLDADTLPQRADVIERLFYLASAAGFCATQFNKWNTHSKTIRGRISSLIGRESVDQMAVNRLLSTCEPSVNGGVFACRPESSALPLWQEWTEKNLDLFIADETVLHAVMGHFLNTLGWDFDVATGGKYNCSPKYQPPDLPDDTVGIWHGHGDSFIRPNKSMKGVKMWWPVYQHCLRENIGGMVDWKDQALAVRNSTAKYIKKLEAEPVSLD